MGEKGEGSDMKCRIYMCACVNACICIHTYPHINAHTHVQTHTYVQTYTQHTCTNTRTHKQGLEERFLEQWHQKLHTNTSPEDIIICEVRFIVMCTVVNVGSVLRCSSGWVCVWLLRVLLSRM